MFYRDQPMSGTMRNALMQRGGVTPSFGEMIQGQRKLPKTPMLASAGAAVGDYAGKTSTAMRAGYEEEGEIGTDSLGLEPAQERKAYTGNTMWRLEGGDPQYKSVKFFPDENRFQLLIGEGESRQLLAVDGFTMGGKGFIKLPNGKEVELDLGEK